MADPHAGAAASTSLAATPTAVAASPPAAAKAAAAAARRDSATLGVRLQEDRVRETSRRPQSNLFEEVKHSSYERVRDLLAARADVNVEFGKLGQNLTFFAAWRNDRNLLQLLVEEYGLNAASEDKSQFLQTPLFYAARWGAVDCCEYLVECRCNPDHRDALLQNPMFYAANHGHQACAEFLLSRHCHVDGVDHKGHTPLFYAAWHGETDLVRWLVRQHADLHRTDNTGMSCLFNASSDCAAALLNESCDPNHADMDKRTALVHASIRGHASIIRLLFGHNASVNATDNWSWTALFHAAKQGHVACCKLLSLELGTNVHHRDTTGRTARDAAERFGKADAAAILENAAKRGFGPSSPVDQSASPSDTPGTPRSGNSERSCDSSASGAPVENTTVSARSAGRGAEASGGSSGNTGPGGTGGEQQPRPNGISAAAATAGAAATPSAAMAAQPPPSHPACGDATKPAPQLVAATKHSSPSVVQNCLEARADPHVPLIKGQNLVFLASTRAQEARNVCEILVEHRVDPTIVDTQLKQTALFFAVRSDPRSGGIDCARYLIAQRCDPDHVDSQGQTPLFYAVKRTDPECMEALILAGAEPNKSDSAGQTPVFYAASSGAEKCMKVLLLAGADAKVCDKRGRTALFPCKTPAVAEILSEYRCNANLRDNTGQTALFTAASHGHADVTRTLLTLRCEINATDNNGETCLFYAARANDAAVCRVLLVEGGADVSCKNKQGLTAIEHTSIPTVKQLLARYGATASSTPAPPTRKRGLEANKGVGCSSNGSQASVSQVSIERDIRRKCVLIFEDSRGRTISPGSSDYKAALRELVAECPWLDGWGSSALL